MADLVLGPILRHVEGGQATIWLETDAPCEVGVLGARARTFQVEGHHYALVDVTGLEPGGPQAYTVELDGRTVWPLPDSTFPPSRIRVPGAGDRVRVVFGSCRVSLPHEPPWVLSPAEHPEGHGIDSLRALALRLARSGPEELPDCLLLLGDQIYLDHLSPRLREVTRARPGRERPEDELDDFDEYAEAYREAWEEPAVRWLLSTVSTTMIFDDHEVHPEWKTSQAWLDDMRQRPWYDRHVTGALMAYWLYQHIGNTRPGEPPARPLLDEVRRCDDAGPLLRERMRDADRQPGHSRWSFHRDLGGVRLVVVDSRAGRELEPGRRRMVSDGEWDWIAERTTGDFDHLVLASSVPFFLAHGLHHLEAWDEAVADGAWGAAAARWAERARQAAAMDQWASFQHSFRRLSGLLRELATGARGGAPSSIVMLSGDVHHCYLAEVGFPPGTGARTPVWQAVCSGYRKALAREEKLAMRLGTTRVASLVGRALAHAAGVEDPPVGWRLSQPPRYENQVATVDLWPGRGVLRVETPAGSDWRDPRLRTLFEERLAGPGR